MDSDQYGKENRKCSRKATGGAPVIWSWVNSFWQYSYLELSLLYISSRFFNWRLPSMPSFTVATAIHFMKMRSYSHPLAVPRTRSIRIKPQEPPRVFDCNTVITTCVPLFPKQHFPCCPSAFSVAACCQIHKRDETINPWSWMLLRSRSTSWIHNNIMESP